MAGEMLGMKLIYMDAGSGAKRPITESMIKAVADHIEVPLIIGGGIWPYPEDAVSIKHIWYALSEHCSHGRLHQKRWYVVVRLSSTFGPTVGRG